MGIRGLKSFIDCNPQLLNDFELHDTYLIIDGKNLMHQIYYLDVESDFGGEYRKYKNSVKTFFENLRKCEVTPIVVFDGGYATDDRKKKTVLLRAVNRNHVVRKISHKNRSRLKTLPILCQEVFYEALIDLGIMFAQSNYEADKEIAVLANVYNCPVLSDDSDFYIYDVSCGFIPMHFILNSQPVSCEHRKNFEYMKCKLYHVDNFLCHFPNFDKKVLPVFSAVMGNDYTAGNTFESFFKQLPNIPKFKSKISRKRLVVGRRFTHMIVLLQWLEGKTLAEAVEKIVFCLKKSTRETAEKIISVTIEIYNDNTSSCWTYFKMLTNHKSDNLHLNDVDLESIPSWFMECFRTGEFPSFMLNIFFLQRVMLLTQIENVSFKSSYSCSLYIRKVIYGILHAILPLQHNISEYHRIGKNFRVENIEQITKLEDNTDVAIDSKGTVFDGEMLFFKVLCVEKEFCEDFPTDFKFACAIIRFWLNNANPVVSFHQLNSVLVCVIYFGLILKIKDGDTSIKDSFKQANISMSSECALSAFNNLAKFFLRSNVYDIDTIHQYCQLQSCLLFSMYLMKLVFVKKSVARIRPTLFSGIFIHNLCRDLEGRSCPDLYISELLVRDSPLCSLFFLLRNTILIGVDNDRILNKTVLISRGKKKKKTKDNKSSKCMKDISAENLVDLMSDLQIDESVDILI